jgi:hypothetical protein
MEELNQKTLIFQSMVNRLTLKDLSEAFPSMYNFFSEFCQKSINDILPKDIIVHILAFTELRDTFSVSLVCKQWNNALYDPRFWDNRIKKRMHKLEIPSHVKNIIVKADFFAGDMNFLTLKQRLDFLFMNQVDIYNHITYSR